MPRRRQNLVDRKREANLRLTLFGVGEPQVGKNVPGTRGDPAGCFDPSQGFLLKSMQHVNMLSAKLRHAESSPDAALHRLWTGQ
jgi:hypothetical protein